MKKIIAIFCSSLLIGGLSYGNLDSKFGVCAHTNRQYENVIQDQMYDAMRDAGIGFMRTSGFGWGHLRKADGSLDFSTLDDILARTKKRNISILAVLSYGVGDMNAHTHPKEWADYITKTVSYFKGRVTYWEIINEHDMFLSTSYGAEDGGKKYGEILKIAYEAVKKGNPDAVVLYGGLAGVPEKYVEASLKVAGTSCFDIMNYHTYCAPSSCEPILGNRTKFLKKIMKEYGGEKPIWITEIGSSTPENTLDTQPIVLACIKYLNLKPTTVYALGEGFKRASEQVKNAFPKARKYQLINYADIKKLPDNAVLFMPISQSFNYDYNADLVDFVRRGGTFIYAGGGFPMGRDTSGKNIPRTKNALRDMRVHMTPPWVIDSKMPTNVSIKKTTLHPDFKNLARKKENSKLRTFSFSDKYLQEGDTFIPVATYNYKDKKVVPIAIYKFNSDFKGNVVLITNRTSSYVTRYEQALHQSRYFLYGLSVGIDKIFIYHIRSHGRVSTFEGSLGILDMDLTRKPAFHAYSATTKLMGKATPKIEENKDSGLCKASWKSPEGKSVLAVWSYKKPVKATVSVAGKYQILDIYGKVIEGDALKDICKKNSDDSLELNATASVIYIVSEK